jgi:TolB-like protein/Tfp pilus assembly protein PilF
VFLSYASQDVEAAQRISASLRSAGIEVWFDQSELRGGDAWDRRIREWIHECRLFVPVISANTEARSEGYFRREWKLAIDRTRDMSERIAFIVPVVIDQTPDARADVPEAFRSVQWTRLPAGETPLEFVRRILQLLSGEANFSATVARGAAPLASGGSPRLKPAWVAVALAAVAAYFIIEKPWVAKSVAFAPPLHSIAVLPFVNMSGDKEQEYFSDGLTEELLNSLAEINELQVAARTSAFSFKGKDTDIGTIARKLNVGAVLEGSVRRSGNTVRITTQLINAVTGFHLWSHTYDRDLGDVLKLETEIADAVASSLKVRLLGDVVTKIELGATRNTAAFDAYLRASKAFNEFHNAKDLETAIASYTEAIRLDPNFALAFAGRSQALVRYAAEFAGGPTVHESYDKARADAQLALALASGLGEGHLALGDSFAYGSLDFPRAIEEYERAAAQAPGSARVLRSYGLFAVYMGHTQAGIAALRRAVVLDPLNHNSHNSLGEALYEARRYKDALAAFQGALALEPDDPESTAYLGLVHYALGNFKSARTSCELKPNSWQSQLCLAVTYDKLGRHADAEAAFAKMRAAYGDNATFQYVEINAQWGNTTEALGWLDKAMGTRDPGLIELKLDPLLDSLRQSPRFQAIERELKFPH